MKLVFVGQHLLQKKFNNLGYPVHIKSLSGRTTTLYLAEDETIELIMWKLFCATGINPEDQLLVFEGKQVAKDKTLNALKIKPDSTLNLVIRVLTS